MNRGCEDSGGLFRARLAATLIDTFTFVGEVPTLALEGRLQVMKVCGLAHESVTVPLNPESGVRVRTTLADPPAASDTGAGDVLSVSSGAAMVSEMAVETEALKFASPVY